MVQQRKAATATTKRKVAKGNKNVGGKGAYDRYTQPGGYYARNYGESIANDLLPGHLKSLAPYIGKATGFLGHQIGRLFGKGEYKIGSAPVMNSLFHGARTPSNLSFGDNSVRIKHREYIADVITSNTASGFDIHKYVVNPADGTTFPWLSKMACNFQTYQFNGLVFEYVSHSADALNSTNTNLGSVIMAPDYNVESRGFTSKSQMLNSSASIEGKPSDSLLVGIECDPKKLPVDMLFVNPNKVKGTDVDNDQDSRLTDLCDLYVASVGNQGTSVNIGSLYVTYDISFSKPILDAPGTCDEGMTLIYKPTEIDSNNWLGRYNYYNTTLNNNLNAYMDNVGFVVGVTASTNKACVLFPPNTAGGCYTIIWRCQGSTGNCQLPTLTTNSGLSQIGLTYYPTALTTEYGYWVKITVKVAEKGSFIWKTTPYNAVTSLDENAWPGFFMTNGTGTNLANQSSCSLSVNRINQNNANSSLMSGTYLTWW